jgi:ribosome-associated protein
MQAELQPRPPSERAPNGARVVVAESASIGECTLWTDNRFVAESTNDLVVTDRLTIASGELVWRFSTSSGPGGQHVNTSNSRVELVLDLASSPSLAEQLSETERARVLDRLGNEVRIVAQSERSQLRNRTLARQRLAERIRRALAIEPPRRPTRPSKGSVERRIQAKRVQSTRKSGRRAPRPDDD